MKPSSVNSFTPASDILFFSKNDLLDIRLGELFKSSDVTHLLQSPPLNRDSKLYCILGYQDDEGIKLNGGRAGAAEAPHKIREYLYKMTPPCELHQLGENKYLDIGNLNFSNLDLAARHQNVLQNLTELYKKNITPISFGGGHDYGYPDAAAFVKTHQNSQIKPVVLNFDAHLDVRPTQKGFSSGTPFYRLLNEVHLQFEFAEIGIQPQCNSVSHKKWAQDKGAHIFELSQIQQNLGLCSLLEQDLFKQLTPQTPVFISFDIDSLNSSEAGGCSQSWATGLSLTDYLNFFKKLSQICDLKGLGIYEVSPSLDTDNRTSKTAALIAYHFIFQGQLT